MESELLQHQPPPEKQKAAVTLVEMLALAFLTSPPVSKTTTKYKSPVSCFHVVKLVNEDLRPGQVSNILGLTSAVPRGMRMPD